MTTEGKLTPEQTVRLLRAKAGELEGRIYNAGGLPLDDMGQLNADLALLYGLAAERIEYLQATVTLYEAHTENLIERVFALEERLGI